MKNEYYLLAIGGGIILLVAFILINQSSNYKFIESMDKDERKHREEILKQVESIRRDREEIQKEIEDLKKIIQEQEDNLNKNIQQIKLKANVQVRNFTDSTNAAILKSLLPK